MSPQGKLRHFLAIDLGGTNLSLGLFRTEVGRLHLLNKSSRLAREEVSLLDPCRRFLDDCRREGHVDPLDGVCVAGAGPILEGRIELTNLPWNVAAAPLEAAMGCRVLLINDFTALAHAIATLHPHEDDRLVPLPGQDGLNPRVGPEGIRLIVGAGTGLGVGFVAFGPKGYQTFPSEGGHLDLPVLDEEGLDFWKYLRSRFPAAPGSESAVSGPGIANLFHFGVDTGRIARSEIIDAILALPLQEQPSAIAAKASTDPSCGHVMDRFVDHFARVAASLSMAMLPSGGLYLAGGIAAKNIERFTTHQRFRNGFERNYRGHLDRFMAKVPIFIVRDYGLSLFGAAQAVNHL